MLALDGTVKLATKLPDALELNEAGTVVRMDESNLILIAGFLSKSVPDTDTDVPGAPEVGLRVIPAGCDSVNPPAVLAALEFDADVVVLLPVDVEFTNCATAFFVIG